MMLLGCYLYLSLLVISVLCTSLHSFDASTNISLDPVNLMRAIELDERLNAETLIRLGVDRKCLAPMLEEGDFYDPIQLAVFHGRLCITSMLLEFGSVTVNGQTRVKGHTALHLAAKNGSAEMIKLLVANGFDPNVRCKQGHLAIDYTAEYPEAFYFLLAHTKSDLIASNAATPFQLALKAGDLKVAKRLLPLEDSLMCNAVEPALLRVAKMAGSLLTNQSVFELLEEILKHTKCNVNATDSEGRNIFHVACMLTSRRMMTLCEHYKVNVTAKDIYGKTPNEYLVEPTHYGEMLIKKAAKTYAVYERSLLLLAASRFDENCLVSGFPAEIIALFGRNLVRLEFHIPKRMRQCDKKTKKERLKRIASVRGHFTAVPSDLRKEILALIEKIDTRHITKTWNAILMDLCYNVIGRPNAEQVIINSLERLMDKPVEEKESRKSTETKNQPIIFDVALPGTINDTRDGDISTLQWNHRGNENPEPVQNIKIDNALPAANKNFNHSCASEEMPAQNVLDASAHLKNTDDNQIPSTELPSGQGSSMITIFQSNTMISTENQETAIFFDLPAITAASISFAVNNTTDSSADGTDADQTESKSTEMTFSFGSHSRQGPGSLNRRRRK